MWVIARNGDAVNVDHFDRITIAESEAKFPNSDKPMWDVILQHDEDHVYDVKIGVAYSSRDEAVGAVATYARSVNGITGRRRNGSGD